MTELPHMPIATDAYIGDTTHLSLEQHGAYLLLLLGAWRARGEPGLPDDDKMLARMLGVTMKKWMALKSVVMAFWTLGADGRWTQKKQLEVRRAVIKRIESSRNNGKRGGRPKSLTDNDADKPGGYSQVNPNDNLGENNQNQTLPSEENTRPKGLVSESDASDAPKRGARKSYPEAFEAAWRAYPSKENQSKVKAGDAWSRLDAEDRAKVAAAIPGFIAFCKKDPTYRPVHMVRFITERRFDNYVGEARAAAATPEDWSKRLAYGRKNGTWSSAEWGPAPGQPGCLVPADIIQPGDGAGWSEWRSAT